MKRSNLWFSRLVGRLRFEQKAQTMAEYALVLALVAVAGVVTFAFTGLAQGIADKLGEIVSAL